MVEYIKRESAIAETRKPRLTDSELRRRLAHTHAADVRPVVHGKWRPYSPLTDTYECDKCGYQVIDEIFRTNFCPNCGADMREES